MLTANAVFWWVVFAIGLLLFAWFLGWMIRKQALGILVDNRGRFSLSQFQMVLWTVIILSLIAGVFVARLITSASTALDFAIPRTLLLVMGISLGSAASAAAIKGTKDQVRARHIAASDDQDRPRWWQLFTLEEGALADQVIDIGKFQNLWLTLVLVVAYVAMTLGMLNATNAGDILALPDFSDSMVALLLISHAGYLANKLPNRDGEPQGLTVSKRNNGFSAVPAQPEARDKHFVPRNPVHS